MPIAAEPRDCPVGGLRVAAIAVSGEGAVHVQLGGAAGVRLDLASWPRGDATIAIAVPASPSRLASVARLSRMLGGEAPPVRSSDRRVARLAEALAVADARAAGASLRDIAALLLGGDARGDWPGHGDHIKSLARRRVALARRLIEGGARAVLARTI